MPAFTPGQSIGQPRERGLAAVEFAILLPLVLLIMLATAELGRALYQYNTLTKAVRDGARYLSSVAIIGGTGVIGLDADKVADTRNLVIYGNTGGTGTPLLPGLAPGQITVTVPDPLQVQVQAAYPYQSIFATLPGFGLMSDIGTAWTLTAATTMRAL
jgi:Flp pilus assembly protein TadG